MFRLQDLPTPDNTPAATTTTIVEDDPIQRFLSRLSEIDDPRTLSQLEEAITKRRQESRKEYDLRVFKERYDAQITSAWEALAMQRQAIVALEQARDVYLKDTGVRMQIDPRAETIEALVTLAYVPREPGSSSSKRPRPKSKGVDYPALALLVLAAGYGPAIRVRVSVSEDRKNRDYSEAVLNANGSVTQEQDGDTNHYPDVAHWLQEMYLAAGKTKHANPLKAVWIANQPGAVGAWVTLEVAQQNATVSIVATRNRPAEDEEDEDIEAVGDEENVEDKSDDEDGDGDEDGDEEGDE